MYYILVFSILVLLVILYSPIYLLKMLVLNFNSLFDIVDVLIIDSRLLDR